MTILKTPAMDYFIGHTTDLTIFGRFAMLLSEEISISPKFTDGAYHRLCSNSTIATFLRRSDADT